MRRYLVLFAVLLFFPALAIANDVSEPPSAPPPGMDEPGIAPAQDSALTPPDTRPVRDKATRDAAQAKSDEAAVTVRQQGDDTVEEYRENGRVWMIRIVPKNGPTQTFMDTTGSGRLTRDSKEGPIAPVYFTLYEWE